jgi:single-stranded-DNA-specific exonuclease
LNQCRHLLSRFGGHSLAAGFTLPTRNLDKFIQTLYRLAEGELADKELYPHLDIDAEMNLSELASTFQLIQQLAPFGSGNPVPSFLSRRVKVVDCRRLGSQGAHLRLKLRQERITWDAVAFRQDTTPAEVPHYIDLVYNLGLDRWNGKESLRLNILDFRTAS